MRGVAEKFGGYEPLGVQKLSEIFATGETFEIRRAGFNWIPETIFAAVRMATSAVLSEKLGALQQSERTFGRDAVLG